MDVPIAYFMAALAWAAICINLVVIPFFSKSENLFKDLIDSGARDLALTNIDSQKLIPALATLIDEASLVRERRVQKGESIEYKDLLQEVDFLPQLAKAQEAIDEKRSIERGLESLGEIASGLWKFGALHAVFVIAVPASLLVKPDATRVVLTTATMTSAFFTLLAISLALLLYEARRKKLYAALGKNRGKASSTYRPV